jgi:gp16 family phage-associated protein
MPQLLTRKQAQEALVRQGKTVADFARENELSRHIVYQVLSGKKKGRYGESHRAAVLLGIKDGDMPPAIQPPPTQEYEQGGKGA